MAPSPTHFLVIFLSFSTTIFGSQPESQQPQTARGSGRDNLILPVRRDTQTDLHVTTIYRRTPQQSLKYVVDLNGRFLWENCQDYKSSTYQAPQCHSTQCAKATSNRPVCFTCSSDSSPRPGCHNNTCGLTAVNPVTQQTLMGELSQDVFLIQSAAKQNKVVRAPNFLSVCASPWISHGLPNNVQGVAGLGHSQISLPAQLSSQFGFRPNFGLCLTSSPDNDGAIIFGQGPFLSMVPGVGLPHPVSYTPLTISRQGEYRMRLTSIRVNQQTVPIQESLLTENQHGLGGTIISTATPYSQLEHSIYRSVASLFSAQFPRQIPQASPVGQFGLCYNKDQLAITPNGPVVPKIDLVLGNQNNNNNNNNNLWTIYGANSMVEARPGVMCLAFVDGGLNPRASIVIGAYQLQDHLVHFDVARSSVGFRRSNCASFNFKTSP